MPGQNKKTELGHLQYNGAVLPDCHTKFSAIYVQGPGWGITSYETTKQQPIRVVNG